MINTLEELLQDYASYSLVEGVIDENTSMHLAENAQNYIKEMKKEKLLSISGVGKSFYCYNKLQGFNHSLCEVKQCENCKKLEQ